MSEKREAKKPELVSFQVNTQMPHSLERSLLLQLWWYGKAYTSDGGDTPMT